ncbi:DNA oxidative demethylase AlkB [Aromatoleum petrolei]|uniref:DNA oxidative demethylase AlkB n=1 Tax=Aromatoleum petrolei TaxID=76116 RepID=A0ABX1MT29_9RHOO|nr:DNA oxidative demethylase AlkB [Aromatoleum petrolei]NMF88287.1 DNA oxidative demethylase AlkB [Aromatoleum petrolei]QTQ38016.1 Alpha-ketoglutarate-dependent dioxygenase [Aromatoleum petrolei]
MTPDLFDHCDEGPTGREVLAPGALVLRGFARAQAESLVLEIGEICARAPFRHMLTPGGQHMSAAMTNCGPLGWVSDRRGYRYEAADPDSGKPWPPMPDTFLRLAADAAAEAGFSGFIPDACLVNRYEPGTRMSLHQDRDERDLTAPIVSVSLGLPAIFLFGGLHRSDRSERVALVHGDVVVWGGLSRLRFHGILPVKEGSHALLGRQRINLTFRKAA